MKFVTTWLVLVIGCTIVLTIWFVAARPIQKFEPQMLESLFTGWAWIAVSATLLYQCFDSRERDAQQRQILKEMNQQTQEIARGARVNANTCLFHFWKERWAALDGEEKSGARKRVTKYQERLEADSNVP